jgi:hypothetical protein
MRGLDKKNAILGIIATLFWVIWFVCVLALFGHATTVGKHRDSLGIVMQQTNPNSFIAGNVTNVEFAGKPENYGMVVRVQPIGTYTLYTEDILLCSDPSEFFAGHSNPMVLVYETVSHHMVEGIGCHELKAVRDVLPEKLK